MNLQLHKINKDYNRKDKEPLRLYSSKNEPYVKKISDANIITLVLVITLTYSTLRYHILNTVPWSDFIIYTINKAIAFSSLILLSIGITLYFLFPKFSNSKIIKASGVLVIIHSLLSFILLNPNYFNKFYINGKFTFSAGLSMLLGIFAFVLFLLGATSKKKTTHEFKAKNFLIITILVGFHTAFQGLESWFTPESWPRLLPPITLISSTISLVVVLLFLYVGFFIDKTYQE